MDRSEHVRWFAREVLPHEPDVRRWLLRRIRGLPGCHVDEIVQEAYARLWAVGAERIMNPRAYFFVTARHVVGEVLRRARVVSIETVADVETLDVADHDVGPERRLSGREEIERLQRVLDKLPPKCREAFELRKFAELSQREIAQRMQLSESTVEKHLVKALRIIMRELQESDVGADGSTSKQHGYRHRAR
ncbi:MAG TPA: RNA polymerase sigma factor [Steroidobacteraceae bacterium]|jgi:RNA polymerase sigma-70 factor (ECF subfamily)|nr:RNA polymerase sigma factor [Steroidobacteraceae bacterium]